MQGLMGNDATLMVKGIWGTQGPDIWQVAETLTWQAETLTRQAETLIPLGH